MIRIGLNKREKQSVLDDYLSRNNIKKIYCFYFKHFQPKYRTDKEIEYIEYSDIIMYKFFYRLLEEIGESSLIIMDGCMRTKNRSDLTYNCAHHYLNQTPHKIIFEFFPIIDTKDDMMILFDFENKGKFHGNSFDYIYLQTEDIKTKPFKIYLSCANVEVSSKDREKYEKKKEKLFDELGQKDPDTIPRTLQLLAGDLKKSAITPDKIYVARNKRFKLDNVLTYADIDKQGNYIVLDMHYRRLSFNDFLKVSGCGKVKYISTTLPIDSVITSDFMQWKGRLDAIYAKASLYK
ncbi:hypothetical protein DFR58_10155 [Anaerobacterium chartisolvens]|uniref:Uncharacterized protein n=1 Tax=Anaerobacterium chartisolvens TaxID=1297424 RepID=A0A369BH23_9FIRM|nr:hypothetical protein [Anaerobacterium chartisolvens]RCX20853.1 hypothetical protein DFR58_10155 [Anaerobacterium chartisolvens]